ncbi:hypothetical protein M2120_000006 [Aurantimicrobium minutum]|nr:hypothetical protein [Aurantimicrobium minutum]
MRSVVDSFGVLISAYCALFIIYLFLAVISFSSLTEINIPGFINLFGFKDTSGSHATNIYIVPLGNMLYGIVSLVLFLSIKKTRSSKKYQTN